MTVLKTTLATLLLSVFFLTGCRVVRFPLPSAEQTAAMTFEQWIGELRKKEAQDTPETVRSSQMYWMKQISLFDGIAKGRGKPESLEVNLRNHRLLSVCFWEPELLRSMHFVYHGNADFAYLTAIAGEESIMQGNSILHIASDRSYTWCMIVPFPGDSTHLLLRSQKPPHYDGFDSVSVEDITAIHLLGNDLESRIQMRFENGLEYYLGYFSRKPGKKSFEARCTPRPSTDS